MNPLKLVAILITGATGLLIWACGLLPYILYFIVFCLFSLFALLICLFIAKNWKGLNIGKSLIVISIMMLLVFSNVNIVKADAYDYDVYIHPDDLIETIYIGTEGYWSGDKISPETNFTNSYGYTGNYIFGVVRNTNNLNITINGVVYDPIVTKLAQDNQYIHLYLIPYSASYNIAPFPNFMQESVDSGIKSYLITEFQEVNIWYDPFYQGCFFAPFYPRYSEKSFYDYLDLYVDGFSSDIDIVNSDYLGSNVAEDISTRTIDDVGFYGSVYMILYKNKTGAYPTMTGISVKTDLWGSAKLTHAVSFLYEGVYYDVDLWRLGFIDTNPLSTSKDIEVTITDSSPSVDEHLYIGLLDDTTNRNGWYYVYYAGYQSATKTDYLINVYSPNDFYANLLIDVYNSTDVTNLPIQDALVKLDYEPATQQTTDVNGSVFYDNIFHGVTRIITVTHPDYYAYEGSIYILQGSNTINIPLVFIDPAGQILDPTPTIIPIDPTPTPTYEEELAEIEEKNILKTLSNSFFPMFGLRAIPTEEEIFKMMVSVSILMYIFSVFIMIIIGLTNLGRKTRGLR